MSTDTRPKGRGLDEARTEAIYAATAELLADVGYERLTMDAVAARAKASKATLYRRWDGKAELVVDALGTFHGDEALPDTGRLDSDLREFLSHIGDPETQAQVCVMRGLLSACSSDTTLAEVVRVRLVETKRQALRALVERALQRGEIAPDRDVEFLVDVIPASLMYRLHVTYQPVDQSFVDRLVDEIAIPLLTQPTTNPTNPGAA